MNTFSELLIAGALVAVVSTGAFRVLTGHSAFGRSIKIANEQVLLRNFIINQYDCGKTKAAIVSECSDTADPSINVLAKGTNAPVLIVKPVGNPMDPSIYSNYQGFAVKASCVACTTEPCVNRVKIEFAKFNLDGKFAKDPQFSSKEYKWQDLFDGFGPGCPI